MDDTGHLWVETASKWLFIQKCPQYSQKMSASIACMLATFSMSGKDQVYTKEHRSGATLGGSKNDYGLFSTFFLIFLEHLS